MKMDLGYEARIMLVGMACPRNGLPLFFEDWEAFERVLSELTHALMQPPPIHSNFSAEQSISNWDYDVMIL